MTFRDSYSIPELLASLIWPERSRSVGPWGAAGMTLAGVTVGMAAGLLVAPQSGSDMRASLMRGAKSLAQRAQSLTQNVGSSVQHAAKRIESGAEEIGTSRSTSSRASQSKGS